MHDANAIKLKERMKEKERIWNKDEKKECHGKNADKRIVELNVF